LINNIDSCFITHFSPEKVASELVDEMSEALEQLKRKVADLKKESEELQRYKKEIDWLKTLQKKLVRDGFD
jgi:prefoldin subunit 5